MTTSNIIADLSQRIRTLEQTHRRCATESDITVNGLPGLERLLCDAGWPRGGLVEWLAEGRGTGSTSLALWASRAAWRDSLLVMIDSRREIHAPAAVPFAEYRFLVQPLPQPDAQLAAVAGASRRWRVQLLRARHQKRFDGESVIVELSDGPDGLSLTAQLAAATPAA